MPKQLKSTLGIILYILGLGLALFVLWYWAAHPSLFQMQLLIELWWLYVIAILGLSGGRFLTVWKGSRMQFPDSPYFVSGYSPYSLSWTWQDEQKIIKQEKPKWWRCECCGGANYPKTIKCEHCNALKALLNPDKCVNWNMSPDSTFRVKAHDVTWLEKTIERINRLWNGLKSMLTS